MPRQLGIFLLLVASPYILTAQNITIPIWGEPSPGTEESQQKEKVTVIFGGQTVVRNVTHPTITVFLPEKDKATGMGIIVCPGGGFRFLSWENEGTLVAKWLADQGIAAFVLKYRLIYTGETEADFQNALADLFRRISATSSRNKENRADKSSPVDTLMTAVIPLAVEDGKQAIRYIRNHAGQWTLKPDKIGIMGFSAGGMVTLGVAQQYDSLSRPDFAAAVYAPWEHSVVPCDAPPLFILAANDDPLSAASVISTAMAWQQKNRPVEIHLFEAGGHGFGMRKQNLPADCWPDIFLSWLQKR